jgi:hypothetical protein
VTGYLVVALMAGVVTLWVMHRRRARTPRLVARPWSGGLELPLPLVKLLPQPIVMLPVTVTVGEPQAGSACAQPIAEVEPTDPKPRSARFLPPAPATELPTWVRPKQTYSPPGELVPLEEYDEAPPLPACDPEISVCEAHAHDPVDEADTERTVSHSVEVRWAELADENARAVEDVAAAHEDLVDWASSDLDDSIRARLDELFAIAAEEEARAIEAPPMEPPKPASARPAPIDYSKLALLAVDPLVDLAVDCCPTLPRLPRAARARPEKRRNQRTNMLSA